MQKRRQLKMSVKKLNINGVVDGWMQWQVDDFFDYEVSNENEEIELYVNSGGGSVVAGLSIYNRIRQHQGKVTAYITGFAASMASVIPLAANEVVLSPGAVVMIHDPLMWTEGNINDHKVSVQALEKIKDGLVEIYLENIDIKKEEISDLMAKETWLNADEAIELGWADRKDSSVVEDGVNSVINNIAAYVVDVNNAPECIKKKINELKNNSDNINKKTEVKNSMSERDTDEPKAPTAEDLEAVKAKAVDDAQNRVNSIISAFKNAGCEGHEKMAELLSEPTAGELEALKACNEILKAKSEAKPDKTAAEKELEARNEDEKELEGVNSGGGNGEKGDLDSKMDVNSFVAGMKNFKKGGK